MATLALFGLFPRVDRSSTTRSARRVSVAASLAGAVLDLAVLMLITLAVPAGPAAAAVSAMTPVLTAAGDNRTIVN